MRGAVLLLIVAQGAALPSSRPIEKFDSAWLSEFLGTNVESLSSATVAMLEPLMASLNTMVPLSSRGITFAGASYGDAKAKDGKECKKAKISIDLPLLMSATCMKQCKAYAESKGYEKEFCCEFDREKSSSEMCKISEDGKGKYKSGDKTVFIFEPGEEEETYDYDDYDDDEATPPPPSPSPPSPSSSNWYVSTTSDKRCGYPDKQATLEPKLDVADAAESCKLACEEYALDHFFTDDVKYRKMNFCCDYERRGKCTITEPTDGTPLPKSGRDGKPKAKPFPDERVIGRGNSRWML